MQKKTETIEAKITCPSGRSGSDSEFRSLLRSLFVTEHGKAVLDYLEYKSLSYIGNDVITEEKASYVLGRREFMDLIKRLATR